MRGGRNTRRSSAELTQVCKLQSNVLMESSSLWHERVVRDSLCLMDEMTCFYRVWGFLAFLNPIRVAVNKNKAICILFWNKMFKLQRMNSVLQMTPKKLNLFVDFAVRVSLYPDVINTQYCMCTQGICLQTFETQSGTLRFLQNSFIETQFHEPHELSANPATIFFLEVTAC